MSEEFQELDNQQEEVKTFTQEQVNAIVQERLARVKKEEPEDYQTLKEITNELQALGYQGSAKEMREAIKAQREAYQQQLELEQLQSQAEEQGITPALAKEIKALKDELNQSKKALDDILGEKKAKLEEVENQKKIDEHWNTQVKEFEEEFPNTNLEELGKNEKFLDFVEGSGWTLKQGYKKFVKIYGEIENETATKVLSKQMRSTSNGKSESSTADYSGLSEQQKKDLQEWNRRNPHLAMTANEFKNRR